MCARARKQPLNKVRAPRKVKGWKFYKRVEAKGQIGYIGARQIKGAFDLKELITGKVFLRVVPSKLHRIARCVHGWISATMYFDKNGTVAVKTRVSRGTEGNGQIDPGHTRWYEVSRECTPVDGQYSSGPSESYRQRRTRADPGKDGDV